MRFLLALLMLCSVARAEPARVSTLREGHVAYSPRRGLVAVLTTAERCGLEASDATLQVFRVGETKPLRQLPAGEGGEGVSSRGANEEHEANRVLAELGFEVPRDELVCRFDGETCEVEPALRVYGLTIDEHALHRDAQTFELGAAASYVPSIGLVATLEPSGSWTLAYVR